MGGQFNFRKFTPSQELVSFSKAILSEIVSLVPVDSALMATVTKVRDEYLCRLEVFSGAGEFVAETSASDPMVAIEQIDEQIADQMLGHKTQTILKNLNHFWLFDRNRGQNPLLKWPGREV
jgi:hypothetical protein